MMPYTKPIFKSFGVSLRLLRVAMEDNTRRQRRSKFLVGETGTVVLNST